MYLFKKTNVIIFLISVIVFSCSKDDGINDNPENYDTFVDSRDGKTYKTVTIGDQVWMAENLAYLPSVNNPNEHPTSEPGIFVYGYYGTDVNEAKKTTNYSKHGVLYSYSYAKKLCPSGWHLPSNEEWDKLISFLGSEDTSGGKLKAKGTEYWLSPNTDASDEVGFSALPSGRCSVGDGVDYDGYRFASLGEFVSFYSTSVHGHDLYFDEAIIRRTNPLGHDALSVRCIKD